LDYETVEAIICTEVLEHAVDHEILIAEMFRVLKHGGKMYITVPFIWDMHEVPYDYRRFTDIGLDTVATKIGFEVYKYRKLVQGEKAVAMIVESEINNLISNISKFTVSTHLANYLHRKKCVALTIIWTRYFSFDRIYMYRQFYINAKNHHQRNEARFCE
jgi:ubiquinone/menaquinone biosynthesis C-methylase UbiE